MKITKKSKSKIFAPLRKISKETRMSEILMKKPEAARLLVDAGMHCIGCPMAMQETIEQGCLSHGMTEKQIDKLIKELNKK